MIGSGAKAATESLRPGSGPGFSALPPEIHITAARAAAALAALLALVTMTGPSFGTALCLLLTIWAPFTDALLKVRGGDLALRTTQHEGMIEVMWNNRQPEIARATGAVLSIKDGDYSRQLRLTPFELRTGRVSYQRRTDHLTVRMTIELPESAEIAQSVEWTKR